jgi:hypothetical protein
MACEPPGKKLAHFLKHFEGKAIPKSLSLKLVRLACRGRHGRVEGAHESGVPIQSDRHAG